MAKGTTRFQHESLQDAKSIRTLLAALAKGIGKNELRLGDDEDELVLHPQGLMTLRIKAEHEDGRSQVNLRVTWREADESKPSKSTPRID